MQLSPTYRKFALILVAVFFAGTLLLRPDRAAAQAIFFIPDGDVAALADAITTVNSVGAGTINLTANGTYQLTASGLPAISSNLTLTGNGATISGNVGRILTVASGGNLLLQTTTLTNGVGAVTIAGGSSATLESVTVTSNSGAENGGGVFVDANASLTVVESLFTNNSATYGGAIYSFNAASVNISDTIIQQNSATFRGGGLRALGENNTINIQNTAFISNSTTLSTATNIGGGGIAIQGGTLTISNSLFTFNQGGNGGGILQDDQFSGSPPATIQITNTTFDGNISASSTSGSGIVVNALGQTTLSQSCIINHLGVAITKTASGDPILATNNWWGASDGPAPLGSGDLVGTNVTAVPFLTQAPAACPQTNFAELEIEMNAALTSDVLGSGDFNPGDQVTYTVTLTNNGLFDASGVSVEAVLPPQVSLTNATPAAGTSFANGIWSVGNLDTFESVTLQLTGTIAADAAGTLTASAAITGADQSDPNPDNNSDEAIITLIQPPGISVSVSTSGDEAQPGDTVTYTYNITNTGGYALTLSLEDDLNGSISLPVEVLNPGNTTSGAANYVVSGGDLPGPLLNTGIASGTTAYGQTVTD